MNTYQVLTKSAVTGKPVIVLFTPIEEIAIAVCNIINNGKDTTEAEIQIVEFNEEVQTTPASE